MCPPSCYPPPPPLPPPPSLPHQSIQNVFHIITVVSCFTSVFFFVIFFYIVVKPFSNQNTSTRSSAPTNSTTHDDHVQRDVGSLGLEESVINSITICKYKRGGGLFEGNECPICPNEFCEDENLRLLPNCMHAFHLPCIDTWLKSNANCPLCRMNVNSNPMSSQWTNLSSSSPSSSSSSSGSSEEPQDCIGLEIRGSNGGVGGIHSYTYVDIAALEDSSSAHVNCGYGSKSELGAVNLENDGIQLVRIVVSMDSSPASVISKETPQLTELVQSQALLDTEHEKNNG